MKIKSRFFPALLVLMLLIAACSESITTQQDLRNYIAGSNNGLTVKRQFREGTVVRLSYLPAVLINSNDNDSKQFYFVLSFSRNGQELLRQLSSEAYSDLVRTLSFRMIPLISIIPDNSKPITPADCFFQQTYGMAGANELLIAIDSKSLKAAEHFTIRIKEFGLMLGDIDFNFSSDDISRLDDILKKNKPLLFGQ